MRHDFEITTCERRPQPWPFETTEVGPLELTQFDETVRSPGVVLSGAPASKLGRLVAPDGTVIMARTRLALPSPSKGGRRRRRGAPPREIVEKARPRHPTRLMQCAPPPIDQSRATHEDDGGPPVSMSPSTVILGTAVIVTLSAWTTLLVIGT